MNTIQQHKKQVFAAVSFVDKAKFTSAENLQLVAGRKRRGFPKQLKKLGLILERLVAGKQMIYGLSKHGADKICAKKFDLHKVSLSRVEHALIAQQETLLAIKEYGVASYEFEPQAYSHDTRPDVIWVMKQGHKFYIEVELTAKSLSDGDMDRFFLKLISRRTIVIFRDVVLFERYIKYASEYAKRGIPGWKNLDGEWIKFDQNIQVSSVEWRQVMFKMHKQYNLVSLNEVVYK